MFDGMIDPIRVVGSCLSVPKCYSQPTWTANNNRIIILVHRNWLKYEFDCWFLGADLCVGC